MSSVGIRASQRHLREIDTRIYGHFVVPIAMAWPHWSGVSKGLSSRWKETRHMAYSSVEENLYQSVSYSQMMRYNNHKSGIYHKRREKWISSTAYLKHVFRIRRLIIIEFRTRIFAKFHICVWSNKKLRLSTYSSVLYIRTFRKLANQKILQNKLISKKTKMKLYKALIRSVAVYGSECWVLTENIKQKLLVFERKMLRRIFGPTQKASGEWRLKTNEELEEAINNENIVRYIKYKRLSWLGHVERMINGRVAKTVYKWKPYATRLRERPRLRWEDDVRNYLRKIGWAIGKKGRRKGRNGKK